MEQKAGRQELCPVCGKENSGSGPCEECGFDAAKRYELYPTMGRVKAGTLTVSARKKQYEEAKNPAPDEQLQQMEEEIRRLRAALEEERARKTDVKKPEAVTKKVQEEAAVLTPTQKPAANGKRSIFFGRLMSRFAGTEDISPTGKKRDLSSDVPSVGGTMKFGTYAQDEKGAVPSPIEWIVLEKDKANGRALLLSRYGLAAKSYHGHYVDVTWETCDLRKWLNGEFLENSFDAKEKGRILESRVTADRNPRWSTDPGRTTEDKVFLLSVLEVERYLDTEEKRQCQPTKRAVADGAYRGGGNCLWWLRSPGSSSSNAAYVDCGGAVDSNYVLNDSRCARPALWIHL